MLVNQRFRTLWRIVAPLSAPIFLVLVACAIAALVFTRPVIATATSTDPFYAEYFLAENLIDREPSSFWVPESINGEVDIEFRARRVDWVGVRNGNNAPHGGIGTRLFVVRLWHGPDLSFEGTGTFDGPSIEERRFETPGVIADRIEVDVISSYGRQGCLSDIDWGPR